MSEAARAIVAPARIAIFDNARFIVIVTVVVAHAISTIRVDSTLGFSLYSYIYLFHMPAMIALAGLFSRADPNPKALRSTIQLVVTWLIWEVIWAIINSVASGRDLPESWLVSPAWTLWFLVTLATMRILLPYIAQLRHPLLVSVVVALIAGLSPQIGSAFSASRTLSFMPFFVLGWLAMNRGWLKRNWFTSPSKPLVFGSVSVLAVIAVGVAALATVRDAWRIDKWLVWRDDYATQFTEAPVFGFAPEQWWQIALAGSSLRLTLLVIAAVMTFALMVLVPRSHSRITVWGTRTLYVYLLHGPIIALMRSTGVVDWFGSFGTVGVLSLVAFGIALSVVLSLSVITKAFWPIIEPRVEFIYRPQPPVEANKINF